MWIRTSADQTYVCENEPCVCGVNLTVQDFLLRDARIQDLYFNISEMKLLIVWLYITSDAPKYDIIWTENSDVIDSFVSEILKYESSVIVSSTKPRAAVLFTPTYIYLPLSNWTEPVSSQYHPYPAALVNDILCVIWLIL